MNTRRRLATTLTNPRTAQDRRRHRLRTRVRMGTARRRHRRCTRVRLGTARESIEGGGDRGRPRHLLYVVLDVRSPTASQMEDLREALFDLIEPLPLDSEDQLPAGLLGRQMGLIPVGSHWNFPSEGFPGWIGQPANCHPGLRKRPGIVATNAMRCQHRTSRPRLVGFVSSGGITPRTAVLGEVICGLRRWTPSRLARLSQQVESTWRDLKTRDLKTMDATGHLEQRRRRRPSMVTTTRRHHLRRREAPGMAAALPASCQRRWSGPGPASPPRARSGRSGRSDGPTANAAAISAPTLLRHPGLSNAASLVSADRPLCSQLLRLA